MLLGVGVAVESVSDSTEPDSREARVCVFWRDGGGEAGTREGEAGGARATTGAARSLGNPLWRDGVSDGEGSDWITLRRSLFVRIAEDWIMGT
jgi:hypothetical protein